MKKRGCRVVESTEDFLPRRHRRRERSPQENTDTQKGQVTGNVQRALSSVEGLKRGKEGRGFSSREAMMAVSRE